MMCEEGRGSWNWVCVEDVLMEEGKFMEWEEVKNERVGGNGGKKEVLGEWWVEDGVRIS